MESKNSAVKTGLVYLYETFEESLRDVFIASISDPRVLSAISPMKNFSNHTLKLRKRYFAMIEAYVLLSDKESGYEELERLASIIKHYISDDIDAMQKTLKSLLFSAQRSMGSSITQSLTSELINVLQNKGIYQFRAIGKKKVRALNHV